MKFIEVTQKADNVRILLNPLNISEAEEASEGGTNIRLTSATGKSRGALSVSEPFDALKTLIDDALVDDD